MTLHSPGPAWLAEIDIPGTFWEQISHQLASIARTKPDTFDDVRTLLLAPVYDEIASENLLAHDEMGPDAAFFAGSEGDATLASALYEAGWRVTKAEASYYYVMHHPVTGEVLTYVEGDVYRGDQMARV